jgi:cell division protein FtsI/penicillin-binding protein 2
LKIQVFEHAYYSSFSNAQYYAKVTLPAKRGVIFDREGKVLAMNIVGVQIGADPVYLRKVNADLDEIAGNLAKIFGGEKRFYLEKLNERNRRFVWLVKDASNFSVAKFDSFVYSLRTRREKEIYRGIIKIEKFKRYYPYDNLASHVLGAVNNEGKPLMGIELRFDKILRGKDGFMRLTKDGLGDVRASAELKLVRPIDGYSLKLTIDAEIQSIVESELEKGVKEFEAESGVALVVDPWTGDILALANYPGFNPNYYWLYSIENFKNRAIIDAFEPGSTFKIVPASLLLEKDSTKLYARVNIDGGESLIRGVKVVDHEPRDILSFVEVLKYSSNIGMAKLSLGLDNVEFYRHTRNFGFGTYTGIGLPGESKGELKRPDKWSSATKIFMSFGYELRATPLQIAMAYASIANGGVLIQPRIVKEIINSDGKVVKSFPILPVRRVISERTAKILTEILEKVVNEGTGVQAKVENLRIAGKTGTAQIYEFGFYSKSKYRASFVGFFPVEKPKFVCFVMLESPKKKYTGGSVAAPVFKRIAERLIKLSPVEIENGKEKFENVEKKKLMIVKKVEPVEKGKMPDLRNLSLRTALKKISSFDLKVSIVGSGVVVDQNPKPGERITPGMECVVYCRDDFKINLSEK